MLAKSKDTKQRFVSKSGASCCFRGALPPDAKRHAALLRGALKS